MSTVTKEQALKILQQHREMFWNEWNGLFDKVDNGCSHLEKKLLRSRMTELIEALDCSIGVMKHSIATASNLERQVEMVKAEKKTGKGPHKVWSAEEIKILKDLYPHRPTNEIAFKLSRTLGAVMRKANLLGLLKTSEYLKGFRGGDHA